MTVRSFDAILSERRDLLNGVFSGLKHQAEISCQKIRSSEEALLGVIENVAEDLGLAKQACNAYCEEIQNAQRMRFWLDRAVTLFSPIETLGTSDQERKEFKEKCGSLLTQVKTIDTDVKELREELNAKREELDILISDAVPIGRSALNVLIEELKFYAEEKDVERPESGGKESIQFLLSLHDTVVCLTLKSLVTKVKNCSGDNTKKEMADRMINASCARTSDLSQLNGCQEGLEALFVDRVVQQTVEQGYKFSNPDFGSIPVSVFESKDFLNGNKFLCTELGALTREFKPSPSEANDSKKINPLFVCQTGGSETPSSTGSPIGVLQTNVFKGNSDSDSSSKRTSLLGE